MQITEVDTKVFLFHLTHLGVCFLNICFSYYHQSCFLLQEEKQVLDTNSGLLIIKTTVAIANRKFQVLMIFDRVWTFQDIQNCNNDISSPSLIQTLGDLQ